MDNQSKKIRTEVLVAIIGLVGVLFTAVIGNWDKLFSKNNAVEFKPRMEMVGSDNTIVDTTNNSKKTTVDACVITVSPLTKLMEEPDLFGQDIIEVPTGKEFVVIAETETKHGRKKISWYKIEVGSRIGWIRNDTFSIKTKSLKCN